MVLIIFAFSEFENLVVFVTLRTDYNAPRCYPNKGQLSVAIQYAAFIARAIVDTPFLTILKTWTSPFEHSVIIHVCVRLEFPEASARAPCLRISELDRLVSDFTPNTCVLPWRGRVGLVDHPHPPPAVARGHRLVFAATGNVYCRPALFVAGQHYLVPILQEHSADRQFKVPTGNNFSADSFILCRWPPPHCRWKFHAAVEAGLRTGRKGVLIADLPRSYPSSQAETTSVMTDMWPSAPIPSLMTSEFCQRGATVDTPFLADLKTQTSPVERLVIFHIALVQKFQSPGCKPCLRTSGLFHALPRFANQALFYLFSLPEGREKSCRSSLSGRRLRFVVVGHFSRLEPGFPFFFGADGRVPRFGTA
ncbi:hypothetical protein HYC85_028007 [Camellia sinensis]|uniref:Uncharacterized protein n=1 Tax=Camellia sinensis TaxID=4442 RepID=A0A7J7FXW7_CAMSI|nr:hypothetical protein HYC85_028007 [Camellia sinensis]